MVSSADDFFTWAGGLINNTSIFQSGSNFVVVLIAMLVIAVMISPKKPSNWLKSFLPILVWFKILGINVNFMFLMITGILFVIQTMSLEILGNVLQAGRETFSQSPLPFTKAFNRKIAKKKADKAISRAEREYKWDKYHGLPVGTTTNKRLEKERLEKERKSGNKREDLGVKSIIGLNSRRKFQPIDDAKIETRESTPKDRIKTWRGQGWKSKFELSKEAGLLYTKGTDRKLNLRVAKFNIMNRNRKKDRAKQGMKLKRLRWELEE